MGCMNIVIYLLQHAASPDIPTVRGETPLHLAARANQTDIIRILLRNGAQVDARARVKKKLNTFCEFSFLSVSFIFVVSFVFNCFTPLCNSSICALSFLYKQSSV